MLSRQTPDLQPSYSVSCCGCVQHGPHIKSVFSEAQAFQPQDTFQGRRISTHALTCGRCDGLHYITDVVGGFKQLCRGANDGLPGISSLR
jgi:hypothetical protein